MVEVPGLVPPIRGIDHISLTVVDMWGGGVICGILVEFGVLVKLLGDCEHVAPKMVE